MQSIVLTNPPPDGSDQFQAPAALLYGKEGPVPSLRDYL